jgi:CelD/BcsL family acetyltransferase involved in cellulose biosynthesis
LLVLNRLGDWACQWDRLVDASPLPSPFLRSWWLTGTAGPRPCFVLAVQNGQLIGGLALEAGRRLGVPCLRMMGAGPLCPDHLDLLTARGQEGAVIALIGGWLSRRGSRLLILEGVPGASRLRAALPGRVRHEPIAVAPWTQLPADETEYIAARPALFRRNLRRASGRLETEGAIHRVCRGSAAVERLDVLRQLHDGQWGERSNFLPSFGRFAQACRLAAEHDEIAVHEISADQTVIAIMVTFEVAQRVSLYQSARLTDKRWREASTVVIAEAISNACKRGFSEVDFLRGDEDYKRNFTSERRQVVRLRAAAGWLGRSAMTTDMAASKAKALAAQAARRLRRMHR